MSISRHDNRNNNTEKTKSRAEDFDDQDFHEEDGVLGIRESTRRADDADADATEYIGQPCGQAGVEDGESRVVIEEGVFVGDDGAELLRQQNGDNDAVDGDGFAEDNTNQIL